MKMFLSQSDDNLGYESNDIVLIMWMQRVAIVSVRNLVWKWAVMAFGGHNLNDLHMMQVVGHPIAPECPLEILELRWLLSQDQSVITYVEEREASMTAIKLIALDLRSGPVDPTRKISPKNLSSKWLLRQGSKKVVLTTGRPLKAMEFLLDS